MEGERKQVTVLFADVKGSMELSEQLDPEEWHHILELFFTILTEGVHRFEGTVNQYTGDGIMAIFGAPIAQGVVSILVQGGGTPTKLPSSVLAVGASAATKGNILNELTTMGAQVLSTYWNASGGTAFAWFTIDLGSSYEVSQLQLAPRRDRSFNLQVRAGDILVGNKVSALLTTTCALPNLGVLVPQALVPCALPAGTTGRYITVQSNLSLIRIDGFEAYGEPGSASRKPLVAFTATAQSVPLEVVFDASGSTDQDGVILLYGWDFGDGNTDNGVSQTHT